MLITDNDRLQELFLLIGDKVSVVPKRWWYTLAIAVVAAIPAYFLFKAGFVSLALKGYRPPQIIYSSAIKEPLKVSEKKIFEMPGNTYSGYIKVQNINHEWGVAKQEYSVEFKTLGGTSVATVSDSVFILSSSEKLIVIPRFPSTSKPDEIIFSLAPTHFVHKPEIDFNKSLERVSVQNSSDLVVSAAIKNLTAFTIKQINLPVAVYNSRNEIVAVNFTYINDVRSGETRTFQYSWPLKLSSPLRAEITPEINVYDPDVFGAPEGTSPFNSADR